MWKSKSNSTITQEQKLWQPRKDISTMQMTLRFILCFQGQIICYHLIHVFFFNFARNVPLNIWTNLCLIYTSKYFQCQQSFCWWICFLILQHISKMYACITKSQTSGKLKLGWISSHFNSFLIYDHFSILHYRGAVKAKGVSAFDSVFFFFYLSGCSLTTW